MKYARTSITSMTLATCLAVLAGCGPEKTDVGRVKGTVTLDGKPVPEADVSIWPKDDPSLGAATATTDANGKFEILSDPRTGQVTLKPGHYRIGVNKMVYAKGNPLAKAGENIPVPSGGTEGAKNIIPDKYRDAKSSLMVKEIRKGDNDLEIALTAR